MTILGIINGKGGVGKSTISVNLATALAAGPGPLKGERARVLLIDTDPQGSALDWAAVRQAERSFTTVGFPRPTLHREIARMAEGYDFVVIDGAPRSTDLSRSAIMASDCVVIPILPSQFDVWGSDEPVNLCLEAQIYKETLRYCFVVNRMIANTTLSEDVLKALAAFPVPVLNAKLTQRVAFAKSIPTGQAAFELEPHGKAALEIDTLLDHVLSYAIDGQLLPPPIKTKAGEGAE